MATLRPNTDNGIAGGGSGSVSTLVPESIVPTRATVPIPTPPIVLRSPVKVAPAPAPVDTSGKGGVPLKLLSVAAVQSPVAQQSFVNCDITSSWTQSPADLNYYQVDIWFVGYHGRQTPQLMASGTTAPLNFLCDAT